MPTRIDDDGWTLPVFQACLLRRRPKAANDI
jgi:hypothetical protein